MNNSTQQQTALNLWLRGIPESKIAEQLDLDIETIATWRDGFDWQGIRDLIDARASAVKSEGTEETDAAHEMLSEFFTRLLRKRVSEQGKNMDTRELIRAANALKALRAIRREIELSRRDREHRKLVEPDHAA